jgi:5-methylcytosine-specific restriction endonuclease McrA
MNKWNIPDWLEAEVKDRDRKCVYCGKEFSSSNKSKKSRATWEHIINNAKIINRENIALCCFSCNSSKGNKKLTDWLESDYCKKYGINKDTVAKVVRNALVAMINVSNGSA